MIVVTKIRRAVMDNYIVFKSFEIDNRHPNIFACIWRHGCLIWPLLLLYLVDWWRPVFKMAEAAEASREIFRATSLRFSSYACCI